MTGVNGRPQVVIRIDAARAKRRARRKPINHDDLPPAPAMALRAA